jgi:hypothetical protein
MEAITTKYHGATDAHGSRISASVSTKRVYIPYPHELHGAKAHAAAARALLVKIGRDANQPLHVGEYPSGYIFLAVDFCETLPSIDAALGAK